jgi:ribose transport system substrate-binding protein
MGHRLAKSGPLHAAAFATILLSLGGCHHASRPMIAIIPETTAQETWESVHFNAGRIAEQWHWDIYWNGPSRQDDLLQQIQIMDREIARGVYGIILAPDHAVALISPVRDAIAKQIPVAILDNPLAASPGNNVLFVLNDDVETGHLAAERVSHYLKGEGDEVAILGVNPDFLNSITIAETLKDTLRSREAGIHIIEPRSTSFGNSESDDAADRLLQAHPNLRAIVALNVIQTRAAYGTLWRSGQLRKTALIGCEQDFDVIYKVRTGEIDSVIAKDSGTMALDAMQWIQRRHAGEVTGKTVTVLPHLVTRENVDSPEIQRVLSVNGADR